MLGARLRAAAYRESGGEAAPTDYIARWDMAGDSTDETGNYDITLYGGAVQNSDHVDFDGNNDYGQCSRLAFNNNEFTIAIEVRFDSIDSDGVWIANSRSSTSGAGVEWQIFMRPPGSLGQHISLGVNNTSGVSHTASQIATAATDTKYVIVARFTGTAVELFIDDVLQESSAFSGSMNTGSAHTQFAKRGWSAAVDEACGPMDQFRGVAYDRALTLAELAPVVDKIKNGW